MSKKANKAKKRASRRGKNKVDLPRTVTTKDYVRLRLTGLLTTVSQMHIGTRETIYPDDTNSAVRRMAPTLVKDFRGLPYIPATGLRGLLRHMAKRYWGEESELFGRLFGLVNRKNKHSQAGLLRVLDAYLVIPDQDIGHSAHDISNGIKTISRVAIDPVTQTAIERQRFSMDVVPDNSQFSLTIELEDFNQSGLSLEDIARVNQLLEHLSRTDELQLGQGKSHGLGLLRWNCSPHYRQVHAISQSNLTKWLTGDERFPDFDSLWKRQDLPKTKADTNDWNKDESVWTCIPLLIKPQSAFLINETTGDKRDTTNSTTNLGKVPAASFQRDHNGKAIIPGSSIKGMLRNHCRKILHTLVQPQTPTQSNSPRTSGPRPHTIERPGVEYILGDLFGHFDQAGVLKVQSAVSVETPKKHRQFFNALDRFTGGVKDGALYHVEAAWCEQLNSKLYIKTDFLAANPWAQALLIMLLRDALEGDLSIGWGKNKGFGRIRFECLLPCKSHAPEQAENGSVGGKLEHSHITSWEQLVDAWPNIPNLFNKESHPFKSSAQTQFEHLPQALFDKLEQQTIALAKQSEKIDKEDA